MPARNLIVASLVLLGAPLLLEQPAWAQQTPAHTSLASGAGAKASAADASFIRDAIQADMAEVKVGQLAQQKGQSDKVKSFGKMLEDDHSKNLTEAKALAGQMGVAPPTEVNAMQKAMYDKLNGLSGAAFDTAFARDMADDHKKDIAKFQKAAKSGGPTASYAEMTLPALQTHLRTAQSISGAK
jgi:putative membrane protein